MLKEKQFVPKAFKKHTNKGGRKAKLNKTCVETHRRGRKSFIFIFKFPQFPFYKTNNNFKNRKKKKKERQKEKIKNTLKQRKAK